MRARHLLGGLTASVCLALGLGEVYAVGDAETGDVYEQTAGDGCQLFMAAQAFSRLSRNDTFPMLETEVE